MSWSVKKTEQPEQDGGEDDRKPGVQERVHGDSRDKRHARLNGTAPHGNRPEEKAAPGEEEERKHESCKKASDRREDLFHTATVARGDSVFNRVS